MSRNVEIKARVSGIEALMPRARALADGDVQRLVQDDTFFRVPHGRLKLREFGDGSAELIHYQRADTLQA
ncbi:MAG TPA: CYTH domain-containing protein, partial [Burkholderiaceae bacterium]|nr:CYTH domain-containing protein [Burkholderiaceae bacterium]